jgi:predicted component of type VI protein secretion system
VSDHKADLDRIASAVYPHKQDRFTYSADFIVDEIQRTARERDRLRTENARLLLASSYNYAAAEQERAAKAETQAAWESLARRQAEELDRLRAALEQYADRGNWRCGGFIDDIPELIARSALAATHPTAQVPEIGSDSALLDALIDAATGQDVEFSPVDCRIPAGRWRLNVGYSFYVGASPRDAIRVMQEKR